jgi:hypothetical protein
MVTIKNLGSCYFQSWVGHCSLSMELHLLDSQCGRLHAECYLCSLCCAFLNTGSKHFRIMIEVWVYFSVWLLGMWVTSAMQCKWQKWQKVWAKSSIWSFFWFSVLLTLLVSTTLIDAAFEGWTWGLSFEYNHSRYYGLSLKTRFMWDLIMWWSCYC